MASHSIKFRARESIHSRQSSLNPVLISMDDLTGTEFAHESIPANSTTTATLQDIHLSLYKLRCFRRRHVDSRYAETSGETSNSGDQKKCTKTTPLQTHSKPISSSSIVSKENREKSFAVVSLLRLARLFSESKRMKKGGIFVTEPGKAVKYSPSFRSTRHNGHPLDFLFQALSKSISNPYLVAATPALSFAAELVGTQNAFYDRYSCKLYKTLIDQHLKTLLYDPLEKMTVVIRRCNVKRAWYKWMRRTTLLRAAFVAIQRLLCLHVMQSIRTQRSNIRASWTRWTTCVGNTKRQERLQHLLIFFTQWKKRIAGLVWGKVRTFRRSQGAAFMESTLIKIQLRSSWNKWKLLGPRHVASSEMFVNASKGRLLLGSFFVRWVQSVRHRKARRKEQCAMMRESSDMFLHKVRIAHAFERHCILRKHFLWWLDFTCQRRKIRAIFQLLTQRCRTCLLMQAMGLWRMKIAIMLRKGQRLRNRKSTTTRYCHCHMCHNLDCPPQCRYLIEKRQLRRQWQHIYL